MNQYSEIILEKGKEVHILIKSSKLFANIPSQYHDHAIIGIIVFIVVVLPVLLSLLFKGSNKSNNKNKQLVKYGKSPNKSTPIKSPNKASNKSTPNKTPNKTPIKSPNKNNNTPTPSKKQLVKYQYPDQSCDYEDDFEFNDPKSPLKLEAPKTDKKSKTPSKKSKLIVFSPPKSQTRARVPPERLVNNIEKQPAQRRKSTLNK